MSNIEVDRGELSEQPLTADEKQVLSEYFQLEGQRQFEEYQSMKLLGGGQVPGLFDSLGLQSGVLNELSDKQLTLELSQRDHWINLIKSIHEKFYQNNPTRPEILLWALISLEKHAIVLIETGKEEYKTLLQESQRRQLPLISRLGEATSSRFANEISLFYQLLEIEGLSENLIRF
ncbi:MAG: hypothetical protein ACQEP7_04795 [bacterium]